MQQEVRIFIDHQQEIAHFLSEYSSDSAFNQPKNIGMSSVPDSLFPTLLKQGAAGTVGTNLGLELCNPNGLSQDILGLWKFNHELTDTQIYNLAYFEGDRASYSLLYQGNVTDIGKFSVQALNQGAGIPVLVGILDRFEENVNHSLLIDFSTVPGRGLSTYQLLISGFPLVNFEVEVFGNEYASIEK